MTGHHYTRAKSAGWATVLAGIVALTLCCTASAQHSPHDHSVLRKRTARPEVEYVIHATLNEDLRSITCLMDIQFDAGLFPGEESIRFYIPDESYISLTIDSVSYQGVPLPDSVMKRRLHWLSIGFPDSLVPGYRPAMMLSFSTTINVDSTPDPALWVDWFPRLMDADYVIPSSFRVFLSSPIQMLAMGPGELVNETAHYGRLPFRNGVYENVLDSAASSVDSPSATGSAEEQRRTFLWTTAEARGFPIIVASNLNFDRVIHDSLVVDVVSLDQKKVSPRHNLSNRIRRVLHGLASAPLSNMTGRLLVLVTGGGDVSYIDGFLRIPDTYVLGDIVDLAVARGLTLHHVGPARHPTWADGIYPALIDYLTVHAMTVLHDNKACQIIRQFYYHASASSSSPQMDSVAHFTAGAQRLIASQRFVIHPDTYRDVCEGLRRIQFLCWIGEPDWLDSAVMTQRRLTGWEYTWTRLRKALISDPNATNSARTWVRLWEAPYTWQFSARLESAWVEESDGGFFVYSEIFRKSISMVPIELGILTEENVLFFDTVETYHGSTSHVSGPFTHYPTDLVLDPNHYLPDPDRTSHHIRLTFSGTDRPRVESENVIDCLCPE